MKTRRFTLFIVTCSLLIALAFFGCKEEPDPTHTHDWQWVVTQDGNATEDRIETKTCSTCAETDGTRIVAIDREKTITVAVSDTSANPPYESRPAIVKGTLTLAELTTCADTLTTAIKDGFNSGTGPGAVANKIRFRNVFNSFRGDKTFIIIENDVLYSSYEADNRFKLKFDIDYLMSVSAEDLITEIIAAVTAMDNLPPPELIQG